jgi:hypothetical protein
MGMSGQRHAPVAIYPRGKGPPVLIVQEAGWAPEPVWTQRIEDKILSSLAGIEPPFNTTTDMKINVNVNLW